MKTRKSIKIISVVGARPNFIKIAPLIKEFKKHSQIRNTLVHTGQHYDKLMSEEIFKNLDLPRPDINLNIGSDTHARQTAKIMIKFEDVLKKEIPDLVLVVGDVNSTLACTLTAVKLNIPVAHVEAGLRSFNWQMPEEINRVLTDRLSDYLFITEKSAEGNLIKEGISEDKIYFVGNIMIDTLKGYLKKAENSKILKKMGLKDNSYAVLTLHRPRNVDNMKSFKAMTKIIKEIQEIIPIVYPIHPRAKNKLKKFKLMNFLAQNKNLILINPLPYLDFLKLQSKACFILTDSGGIQEEATILKVPCLTLREETERPITVSQGTNIIVGSDRKKIIKEIRNILKSKIKKAKIPEKWDGKTSKRIVKIITNKFLKKT